MPEDPRTGIVPGGNHSFLIGMVLGALDKAGLKVEPILAGTDYTNEIRVRQKSGTYIVSIFVEDAKPS